MNNPIPTWKHSNTQIQKYSRFSVNATSHIPFNRVIRSWSATTRTLQTKSTFWDSKKKENKQNYYFVNIIPMKKISPSN